MFDILLEVPLMVPLSLGKGFLRSRRGQAPCQTHSALQKPCTPYFTDQTTNVRTLTQSHRAGREMQGAEQHRPCCQTLVSFPPTFLRGVGLVFQGCCIK